MEALRNNQRSWLARRLFSRVLARRCKRRKNAFSIVSVPRAAKREILRPVALQLARAGTKSEPFIVDLLRAMGEVPYTEIVEGLAEFLFEREFVAGAAMVEIRFPGKALFVSETRRELELERGKIREFDSAGRKPDELLSNLSRHGAPALPGDRWRRGGGTQDRQSVGSRRGGDGA